MRKLMLLAGAIVLLIAPASAPAKTVTMDISKAGFVPATVTIQAGDTVSWTNKDTANHQVVCATCPFTSAVLAPNATATFTFTKVGKFGLVDPLNKNKKATVTVAAAPATLTAAAAPRTVNYGGSTTVSGTLSTGQANQKVVIVAQQCGENAAKAVGNVMTGAGGAYTFHFTEDLGLEASYLRTREHYEILDAIVDRQQNLVGITGSENNTMQFFMGHLIWSMAYGKVRWMGGGISRYDFYLSVGAGATVQPSVTGLTGSFGPGMKFYLTDWLAIRWDVRDAIHQQKRVQLGLEKIVNDITVTGGLSLFIPFHS